MYIYFIYYIYILYLLNYRIGLNLFSSFYGFCCHTCLHLLASLPLPQPPFSHLHPLMFPVPSILPSPREQIPIIRPHPSCRKQTIHQANRGCKVHLCYPSVCLLYFSHVQAVFLCVKYRSWLCGGQWEVQRQHASTYLAHG